MILFEGGLWPIFGNTKLISFLIFFFQGSPSPFSPLDQRMSS